MFVRIVFLSCAFAMVLANVGFAVPIQFADRVVSFDLGDAPDPATVIGDPLRTFSNPYAALGDRTWTVVSLGTNSELILEFVDNVILDGAGADIFVFESGAADSFARFSVSANGIDWYVYDTPIAGDAYLDLDGTGLSNVSFIRIEGLDEGGVVSSPGYDLDFVEGLNFMDRGTFDEQAAPRVPEPATLMLTGAGLASLMAARRRRKKS